MKANHNRYQFLKAANAVVLNISKSKNESKSQQAGKSGLSDVSCVKYQ
ncbi:hypothetical protein IZT61_05090 [Pedobacter endophyticus]|uniref:Uncharacterized protein n=1 Tax=Pedobacter endophyticus TaxID=2789740 RepID=A0A7S9L1B0_9SPHI|nr:hypothetical protein [Pedobacter endophyticus]QPH40652.1 hypothetical protein IZT61_05090 [Pedobacter endophyticus]